LHNMLYYKQLKALLSIEIRRIEVKKMKLNQFEMMAVKNTAKTATSIAKAVEKLEVKKAKIQEEIDANIASLNLLESPIKVLTNGMGSLEYLEYLKQSEIEEILNKNNAEDTENIEKEFINEEEDEEQPVEGDYYDDPSEV